MMAPAFDVATILESLGIGTIAGKTGWNISVSREALKPGQAITVYDTAGLGLDNDLQDIERPSVQVRVRTKRGEYDIGYAKAIEIRDALVRPGQGATIIVNGARYAMITLTSGPEAIGYDENDRAIFTANYDMIREEI